DLLGHHHHRAGLRLSGAGKPAGPRRQRRRLGGGAGGVLRGGDRRGHGDLHHRHDPSAAGSARQGGVSPMFRVFRDLIHYNLEFAIGVVLVTAVVIFACLSFFSPVDPTAIYVAIPDMPPGAQYWFGTNSRGQDLFWQMSFALRNTLTFGVIVAVISRVLAITVGLAAGYLGGWVDRVLMFFCDIFVAIPI